MSSDILRRIARLEQTVADMSPKLAVMQEWKDQQREEHRENRKLLVGILLTVLGGVLTVVGAILIEHWHTTQTIIQQAVPK